MQYEGTVARHPKGCSNPVGVGLGIGLKSKDGSRSDTAGGTANNWERTHGVASS